MSPISRAIAKPLLALVATLGTLGLCEVVVRLIGTAPEVIPIGITSADRVYQRSKNPILSYELKPNYHNDSADVNFDHPHTNSHGQRDVERRFEKPPGVKRVVLLGDSVVVGFGIKEIDDLMSRQLERLYPNGGVEVINLAVSGYCTRSEVELLKVKGLRYDPDIVILVFVENDFYNFNREARYTEGIHDRPRIINGLFQASHLFRSACLKLNWFGFGLESDPAYWNQRALGDNNVDDGLRLLRELAEQHGFEVIIAAWPAFSNSTIHYNNMMLMPDRPDELVIERLARRHGLMTIRLAEPFQQHWQSLSRRPNPRQYYTVGDEMHPSIAGHRVAAEIFRDIIAGQQLLTRVGPPRTLLARAVDDDDDDDGGGGDGDGDDDDDESALEAARALGTEKSDYAAVHYNLGKDFVSQGKVDEAIQEFEETIRLNSTYAGDAHNEIGVLLFQKGRLQDAIDHYRKSLEAKPDGYNAMINLANALRLDGKVDEATRLYRGALRIRPESFEGHYNLGTMFASQGDSQQALKHLLAAWRLSPGNAELAKRLGLAYQSANNLDEAIKYFRRGIELDADHGELHFLLGKALSSRREWDAAVIHLQRAQQIAPSNANACNSLGIVFVQLGRVDQAIEQFSLALQLDPNNEYARDNLTRAKALRERSSSP